MPAPDDRVHRPTPAIESHRKNDDRFRDLQGRRQFLVAWPHSTSSSRQRPGLASILEAYRHSSSLAGRSPKLPLVGSNLVADRQSSSGLARQRTDEMTQSRALPLSIVMASKRRRTPLFPRLTKAPSTVSNSAE